MKTNANGVRYEVKRTGDTFTLYITDVVTPHPVLGFPTHKCAERYAAGLKPIVENHLIRSAQRG